MNLYTELIALDIGTSCVKLVSIEDGPGKQGYIVKNLEMKELPAGLIGGDFTNPFISDMPVFKDILAGMVKKVKNSRQGYVIGLPDRWVKLHLNNMQLTENERKSSEFLAWRLQKSLPIPEGMPVKIDFQILSGIADQPDTFQVLAAAVNSDIIDILSRITTDLEIEVMAFDTSSLGIFNLFEEVYPEKIAEQIVVNLHVGHETTVIKAYSNGNLLYERVIEVAGEEFAKIISEIDTINLENAMRAKETEKFFPVNRADIELLVRKRQRIDRIFGNWLRELNVTFRFFQEKFNVSRLPNIFMTGGSTMFAGLDNFLSEYFETNCFLFNPLNEIPLAKKIDSKLLAKGPAFAACVGLLAK
ncbi:MAG: pilus assembly protein PilM [Candidatus Riflebacteria bacterium]|nr:pilus assembly protein PilM [Candidatus Riflebacteria bacterium]